MKGQLSLGKQDLGSWVSPPPQGMLHKAAWTRISPSSLPWMPSPSLVCGVDLNFFSFFSLTGILISIKGR